MTSKHLFNRLSLLDSILAIEYYYNCTLYSTIRLLVLTNQASLLVEYH